MLEHVDIESHKIFSLEAEKRDRVINAAMREFCNGFKNASTENIVREAGISKGLLFHYFGTKRDLYLFVIQYAINILLKEYYGLLDMKQHDILEILWQIILLKIDLSYTYPAIFDFAAKLYAQTKDDPADEAGSMLLEIQNKTMSDIIKNIDTTQFKEGLDTHKAANIVWWTLVGYSNTQIKASKSMAEYQSEYEVYLSDMKAYFDIFRKCFYKQPVCVGAE